jgi:hypothetical protein
MKVGLKSWQWIGIALSIGWATVGAPYWSSKVNENAWAHAEEIFITCRDSQPRNESFDACLEDMQADYNANSDPQPGWNSLVERALIPIAPGWLAVYGLIAIYRRIKRRFTRT